MSGWVVTNLYFRKPQMRDFVISHPRYRGGITLQLNLELTVLSAMLVGMCFTLANCQHTSSTEISQPRAQGAAPRVVKVRSGENLQKAIEGAQPGDRLLLAAGATYGAIVLPYKPTTGDQYVTVETEGFTAIVKDGERVQPAQHSSRMAKILSSAGPAVGTAPQAHHYKFIGIEFAPSPKAEYIYNLIDLGASDYNSLAQFPHHLFFDRCYVHSTGLNRARRGFAINTGETSVLNSYVSGFAGAGDETQAIAGWNGPGPIHIVNNFLQAGGEIIMFGGTDPSIPNLVPSDIEIRRNHLHRPSEWEGRAAIKGTFELKNARRVVVDGNLIDSRILTTAFVITVRNQYGKAPWSTIEDVEITNNIVRHASSGFNILGNDNEHPSQTARRIRISNNLVIDVVQDNPANIPFFLQINGGDTVTVEHNTVQQNGNIITSYGQPTHGFIFRNNIVQFGKYGLVCVGEGPPCKREGPFCRCFPDNLIKANVIADNENTLRSDSSISNQYPVGNFFVDSFDSIRFVDYQHGDWRLAPESKVRSKATDGKDPGIDINALNASGVRAAGSN